MGKRFQSKKLAQKTLALPIYPELETQEIEQVAREVVQLAQAS